MFEPWTVVTTMATSGTDEEIRDVYGEEAIVSRVRGYNLIHLDAPGPDEIRRRIAEFDPEDLFDDDCPLCRMMKAQGVDVVFLGNGER